MQRLNYLIAAMTAVLTFGGCAKELEGEIKNPDDARGNEDATMLLGAALPDSPDPQTKTGVSDNGDKTYSVFWTEGDRIVVNGKVSRSIVIDQDDNKNATFTMDVMEAPYCAVYPAEAYVADSFSAETDTLNMTVPATQKYAEGSFDPAAAIMYAYSENAENGIAFKHAMAYLKLTATVDVKSVRVNGNNNEAISGEFTGKFSKDGITFSPKKYAGKTKGNTSVTYSNGDAGITAGTPMLIAIPASLYAKGLVLTVVDMENHFQVLRSTASFHALAGKVYPTSIQFNSSEVYVDGGIYTVEDWNAFVASVNSGEWDDSKWNTTVDGKKGAHLMADIYSETNLQRTNVNLNGDTSQPKCEWNGTFYGHGHTITHSGSEPLFIYVGADGKIQDLKVSGTRFSNTNNGWPSVIALNNAGEIRNCESNVDFTLSGASTSAFGICRDNTGVIVGCKNTGKITITDPKTAVNVAGITKTSSGTLVNCTNEGEIKITGVNVDCIVGGIVQSVASGEADMVNNLTNKAAITIEAELTAARMIFMGGIAANAEYNNIPTHFLGCKNEGALKITKSGAFHMKGGAIGGIVAAINYGTYVKDGQGINFTSFDSCTNSGNISFYESERGDCPNPGNHGAYAIGGILGRCASVHSDGYYITGKGYYTVIRNTCHNTGTIDVCTANGQAVGNSTSGARQTYVGAIAGFVDGGTTTSYVRGNTENQTCTIKVGSLSGGICAGGILGGGYKVNIDGGSNANVSFMASGNDLVTPTKVGFVGAVLGWAISAVNISKTNANASFGFDASLTSDTYSYGFAGVKTSSTLTVTASGCTYNGKTVTAEDIYGGGTKTIK